MKIDLKADVFSVLASEGEEKTRTIAGVAVPYGVEATALTGPVRIEKGAIRAEGKPKFIRDHDLSRPLGVVTELIDSDEALMFEAKISATRDGDEALVLASDGVLDSVSVGLDVEDFEYDGRTMVVKSAVMRELSLLAFGAFPEAKVASVAASEPEEPTTPEGESEVDQESKVEAAEPATIETPKVYASPKSYKLPSAGEYILAMKRGGHDFAQLNDNIQQVFAATGDVLVSDADGVIPTPIVAPVYTSVQNLRPIVSALGARSMPEAGASFIRPFVKVASSAGVQANELAALSTADFEVDDITISKKTFGGKLVLSEQVIDWSSPSMLDAAIEDMAARYALATEKEVVDTLAAAVTNTQEVITDLADGEEIIQDLYTAASSIATAGNYLPNALVVSPAAWAKLGGAVDGQGRPLFPLAGPVNSAGALPQGTTGWNGNILGLTLVVSNQVGSQAVGNKTATEYLWLMNTRGVEVYENYKGFLRDEDPSKLGVTLAVRGYFAAKVIDVNMIRILGPDATFGG
jgi:HK97 family phage prohead protease/HK97 family phage major capsid protein